MMLLFYNIYLSLINSFLYLFLFEEVLFCINIIIILFIYFYLYSSQFLFFCDL